MTPLEWACSLSAPPLISSECTNWDGALLRRWSGTSSLMEQPPLDCHYVVMHLGGAKHVTRRRDGPTIGKIAESGSLTLVPAGTAFTWRTRGPIGFGHLYIAPYQLEDLLRRQFEATGCGASLMEEVGCRDLVLERLFKTMLREIEAGKAASALLLDTLLECFLVRLIRGHTSRHFGSRSRLVYLAPHRLRNVLDFVEAHLEENIRLNDLASASGTSQYHFSRAFHAAIGCAPYQYLVQRRIEHAKVLLITGDEPLAAVASLCGFNSRRQFAVMFKSATGVAPKRFRTLHGSALRHCDLPARIAVTATDAIRH
ncbi:MAG: AraC family transcriptional regulator [Pseudomonadota bacterium]|nr:AraC family transcriptional regulator [Pseudomonadota bacterium]